MAGSEWLNGWGGRTTVELIGLEADHRVDSIVAAFEEALQGKAESNASPLSPPELFILAVEALEREVNNGGYSQFFTNSSGFFTGIIQVALDAIGCPITSKISQRAIACLGLGSSIMPKDMEAVAAAASSDDPDVRKILEDCDQDYFGSGEEIAVHLFTYIKAKADQIVLPTSR